MTANTTCDPALSGIGSAVEAGLRAQGHAFIAGHDVQQQLRVGAADIVEFSECWQRLTIDRYMRDGGNYRYRRYGAFEALAGSDTLRLLPVHPYQQSAAVNPLNGGIERHFDELEARFSDHVILQRFVRFMLPVFNTLEGCDGNWLIQLHPYRIVAGSELIGKPVPEGLHRDGVDFVLSMFIHRQNVEGGESSIAALDGNVLYRKTLQQPLDVLVCDDRRVLHDVTDIYCCAAESPASRDVLVIAFSRQ